MTSAPQFSEVILRLLQSLVHKPREVTLDSSPLIGRKNFVFNCWVGDAGRCVGKSGSRLRLLRLLFEVAGRNENEQWWLDQPQNPTGQRPLSRSPDRDIPEFHNPAEDFELLRDLLAVLNINCTLAVSGDVNSGFLFTLVPALVQDEVALTETHQAVFSASQVDTQPISLAFAIESLFKAIGANQRVIYRLAIR